MNIFRRVRDAVQKAAERLQERAVEIVKSARERFSRESLYKEETPPEPPAPEPEIPYNPPEYEQSLSERLKDLDLAEKEKQHRKAYESFNRDFMPDEPLSRVEYDMMWDTIGEYANDSDSLGSPDLIEIYEEMTNKYGYDIDASFVKDFLDHAIQNASDAMYKEDYINAIYDAISNTGSVEEFYESLEDRVYS